jgi:hypothetical protein
VIAKHGGMVEGELPGWHPIFEGRLMGASEWGSLLIALAGFFALGHVINYLGDRFIGGGVTGEPKKKMKRC